MVNTIKDFLVMAMGTLLFAMSITLLSMPNQLAEGGVAGLSLLLYYGLNLSPALVTFIVNGILLAIGYRFLPRRMVMLSLMNIPLLSLFIFLTEGLGSPINDPLLAAIFAGILTGAGFGLIFRARSSMGGTSIIARMLNFRFGFDLTATNFILDLMIVLSGVFIIGPVYTMYTIIALFIGKKAADFVLEGVNTRRAVNIVSNKAPEIAEEVVQKMTASATVFKGHGIYTQQERNVMYIIVPTPQLFYLKRSLKKLTLTHSSSSITFVKCLAAHT
ncbi:membrane protein [Geomicrobium sp. JCM 19037]|uniref:YitT family protein n=1 Tax=Geomicrobium sp. JCM 19037 TaxID=1460634 RepID=UPI00045F4A94|nr:YitT family protein [Geomicrobium sp. JCM 19037]GAK03569.1 membrane protein [Geomicrobium sp. JCM 19037]